MTADLMNFTHLQRMSDRHGVFEHALFETPRQEHGYCLDDVARAIIVLERSQAEAPELRDLLQVYRRFLIGAQAYSGRFVNRRSVDGRWRDHEHIADHWGRAMWALGTMTSHDPDIAVQYDALTRFERSALHRSPYLRSMMFAALGAAEVLHSVPGHKRAVSLLRDAAMMILRPQSRVWPWPEQRLTYANAVVPEVLMLAGHYLDDTELLHHGMQLLDWLLDVETFEDAFSVTPVGGWMPGEPEQGFDQQPIEVAALVDACTTAYDLTSDRRWLMGIEKGAGWFDGLNDNGIRMYDPLTGGGFDGLTKDGRNENMGAESTLAYLSVEQRRLAYLGSAAWI